MSKLRWDEVGKRTYGTGVDRGVLYQYKAGEFKNGVAWNGLTTVSESPSGAEPSPLYADNIKYLNLMSAEEYGYSIEAYDSPDEFDVCDGSAEIASGVSIGQQDRAMFGFCYRSMLGNDTQGTKYGYIINIAYNCLASPSERSHATVNDNPEAETLSWDVTTTPVDVAGYKPTASLKIDSTKIPAAKLALLEDILYGTANSAPRLPLPDEIVAIVGGGSAETGITLTPVSASVEVGESFIINAAVVPALAEIEWSTSDSTKATVSESGVVTGIATGSATITGKITIDGTDYTDTCSVTVTA